MNHYYPILSSELDTIFNFQGNAGVKDHVRRSHDQRVIMETAVLGPAATAAAGSCCEKEYDMTYQG